MYCPNPSCQSEHPKPELMMSERSGIEIDYCPRCRGIWLDRGELDKLLEKAAREQPQRDTPPPRKESHGDRSHDYDKYKEYDKYKSHAGYRKKKSLLSELFDF